MTRRSVVIPMLPTCIVLFAVGCISFSAFGASLSGRAGAWTPEQEQEGFTLQPGFVIELVASEADGIVNPIDLTFDAAGRLWTQTARMYPLDPVANTAWKELQRLIERPDEQAKIPEFARVRSLYEGRTPGEDDILILSGFYDGAAKVDKFATGLAIPQSILPYKNGAFVAQGSELFFLEDSKGDGVADRRTPVLTGFGFTDSHTMSHSLVRAPGGWIHFSQGALNKGEVTAVASGERLRIDYSKIVRFSLDGRRVELVNAGFNNIWGLQLRAHGQWFMTEANDLGSSVVPGEALTAFEGIGHEKLRGYQPLFRANHSFRVGGTGISGLAFSEDGAGGFPPVWKDVAFLANPITSTINCVRIVRNPDGSITAEHLPDLLSSADDWFRPVNIEFGPDGCLYIADWYNKIVSHNEVDTSHPDRDKAHGRIWRIRHESQVPHAIPDLTSVANQALLTHLRSPFLWEKRTAAFQIIDRNAAELTPALADLLRDSAVETSVRIHALWALEGLGAYDRAVLAPLLTDPDDDLRREAIRSLATFKPPPAEVAELLAPLADDPNAMVRSQVLRTLEDLGQADDATIDLLVQFCHPAAVNDNLGDGYETNFERYLARRALERYPAALQAYLQTEAAAAQPAANRVWAQQALGKSAAELFAQQWEVLRQQPLDKDALAIVSDLSASRKVQEIVASDFGDAERAPVIAALALEHIADVYSIEFGYPLAETALALLRSETPAHVMLGLQLIRAYRITHLCPKVVELLPGAEDPALVREILKVLRYDPGPFASQFLAVLNDASRDTPLRLLALTGLVQAQQREADAEVLRFLERDPGSRAALVQQLGDTTQGVALLLRLHAEGHVTAGEIPAEIAERMHALHPQNAAAGELHRRAAEARRQRRVAVTARIPKLLVALEAQPGNAAVGQAVFPSMCLSCHVIGEQGAGIAPALDGLAQRDTAHLLTALLDPDAAVEAAYIKFRAVESSGHITEGLRQRDDARGLTIATQGTPAAAVVHFIPHRTLRSKQPVGNRSFMPDSFATFDDSLIKDLLAYIETLGP